MTAAAEEVFDAGQYGDSTAIGKQTRGPVPLKLGVSDHSKAYLAMSREIVAQFEACKSLILLDNPGVGIPYFEPGGRRFESVRARHIDFVDIFANFQAAIRAELWLRVSPV